MSVRFFLDNLVGTGFHSTYTGLLTQMNEIETDEDGSPKQTPFKFIEDLQQLLWKTCVSVSESEAYADPEPSKPESLQDHIQPPTIHIALAKDADVEDSVVAKVIGDARIKTTYPWDTSRAAQANSHITNSYAWDIAPISEQDLPVKLGPTVQKFQASELFITSISAAGGMQQVHDTAGSKFFFKPRSDLMAPEFDREISVLSAIISCGLLANKTLKLSPFKGLVLLDNNLVAGLLFDWLEGYPLAEHPESSNPTSSLQKLWQEQVEATVMELHRNEIVWGDVNVHNIFIDMHGDAWVIDFGGNCNVEFVDEEIKETYEGDLQGLRRVFEEWLPAQRLSRKEDAP